MNDSPLLADLNEKQREAVMTTEGPVLVVAGAGSGKTRALTNRIAYLIRERGVSPWNILAVTFTNKAAGEMRDRITRLLDAKEDVAPFGRINDLASLRLGLDAAALPTIGTFHSVCVRILRKHIHLLDFENSFVIYDESDQRILMKHIFEDLKINEKELNPRAVLNHISAAKNRLIGPEKFASQADSYFAEKVARLYGPYQERLKKNNALDFDDLLMKTIELFKIHTPILDQYQERFRYIHVDEYQDTNHAQYTLTNLLAAKYRNLCVIGDHDQCLPGDTLIQTSHEKKKISSLQTGDQIISASGGSHTIARRIKHIYKKSYRGNLLTITLSNGQHLKVTPNHLMFGRLIPRKNEFYIYLMYKKEMGYRIGSTQGVRAEGYPAPLTNGLKIRCNQEHADKAWILKVVNSRSEATYWEQYISFKYGIPTTIFHVIGRNLKMTQFQINDLFANIDTWERVKELRRDFFLFDGFPHHFAQGFTGKDKLRRKVNFVMFGDMQEHLQKNPWYGHRVSFISKNKFLKRKLTQHFSVRNSKKNGWRVETSRKDYTEAETFAWKLAKSLEAEIYFKARLTDKNYYNFLPASHIHPGMAIPIFGNRVVKEAVVKKVENGFFDGHVYDLDIENTHNFFANGICIHNSIYSWRGADITNILEFEKDYPEAKVIKMEQNYRSTQFILDSAQAVIVKNKKRKEKRLWTERDGGDLVRLWVAENERHEGELVAGEIRQALKGYEYPDYRDFVVLYRTNAQSRVLEEVFMRHGIPYKIVGGIRFYERKEIKDLLAYLRVISNPTDSVSLLRIVNVPQRQIGPKTLEKLQTFANIKDCSLFEAMVRVQEIDDDLPDAKREKIEKFTKLIRHLQKRNREVPAGPLIKFALDETGYKKFLDDGSIEGEARLENAAELISVASKYDKLEPGVSLSVFLEEVSLVSDLDNLDAKDNAVTFMTLHSAKGLEFPWVFICGLEEGLLPHSRSMLEPSESEEERRLFYVGCTRAMDRLYLLHTKNRMLYGESQTVIPSQFLDDLPPDLIQRNDIRVTERPARLTTFGEKPIPLEKPLQEFSDGDRVMHRTFGEGMVVSVQGGIVTVAFKNSQFGIKKLAITIAPLEKI